MPYRHPQMERTDLAADERGLPPLREEVARMSYPRTLQPSAPHHLNCRGDQCPRCNHRIEAAEDEADWGYLDHGVDMDDRAERDARW